MSKVGRPTLYNEDIVVEICACIAEGESLRTICNRDDMPALRTVMNWLGKYKDFVHQYNIARELQAELYATEIIDISNESVMANHDAMRNKLRVDARKWVASRLLPKKYGDQIGLEVTGSIGIDFAGKLQAAIAAKKVQGHINNNECSVIEHNGSGSGLIEDNSDREGQGESD